MAAIANLPLESEQVGKLFLDPFSKPPSAGPDLPNDGKRVTSNLCSKALNPLKDVVQEGSLLTGQTAAKVRIWLCSYTTFKSLLFIHSIVATA